jgi:hypothetical protein
VFGQCQRVVIEEREDSLPDSLPWPGLRDTNPGEPSQHKSKVGEQPPFALIRCWETGSKAGLSTAQ